MSRKIGLARIRAIEEALKGASPSEAGKLAKKLVKYKEKWLES